MLGCERKRMIIRSTCTTGIALAALAFSISPTMAQSLSHPGCSDISAADFTKVSIIDRANSKIEEPIQVTIAKDGRIFWTERKGKVKLWNPLVKKEIELIKLPVYSGSEFGTTGIALDPKFETNNWVYVFYAHDARSVFRVSRFTLKTEVLDPASEKTLLEIPFTNRGCCHTAGAMTFDFAGNLWVSVGNTTDNGIGEKDSPKTNYVNQASLHGDDQRGSANTNSLLGKILRITPIAIPEAEAAPAPGIGKTYNIPAGNLFPSVLFQPIKPDLRYIPWGIATPIRFQLILIALG